MKKLAIFNGRGVDPTSLWWTRPNASYFFTCSLREDTHKKKCFFLVAWTTKPLGGGVKSLVVRPLKKKLFLCVSSLSCTQKSSKMFVEKELKELVGENAMPSFILVNTETLFVSFKLAFIKELLTVGVLGF